MREHCKSLVVLKKAWFLFQRSITWHHIGSIHVLEQTAQKRVNAENVGVIVYVTDRGAYTRDLANTHEIFHIPRVDRV